MSHRRLPTFVLVVVLTFTTVPASPAEATVPRVAPGLVGQKPEYVSLAARVSPVEKAPVSSWQPAARFDRQSARVPARPAERPGRDR